MQRAHPALTQLWLQWTGVPDLEWATFNLTPPENGSNPATLINLAAKLRYEETQSTFCDLLRLPEKAPERRQSSIYLRGKHPGHSAFWSAMKARELTEVDGPIEWWWRLLVLRHQGIERASRTLIREALSDDLDSGVIAFDNPSLKNAGRMARDIIDGGYRQPTRVLVAFRARRDSPHEGLAFSLADASFRARFVSKLIELAVSRY